MSKPNATEQFRAAMSNFADVSESRDAAEAGFEQVAAAAQAQGEEQLALPLDEPTSDAVIGDDPAAEPQSQETAATWADPATAEDPQSDTVHTAAETDASEVGDLVEMPDGTRMPVSELVRGHLRESDYTKKTTELAEARRQAETQTQHALAEALQATQYAQQLATQLQREANRYRPSPQQMAELRQRDPAEYAARIADQEQQNKLVQAAQQRAAFMEQQQLAQVIPQQRHMLGEKVRAFKDNFDAEYKSLGGYAMSQEGGGLLPEEWDQLVDHRHVTLVWKAMQYDKAARSAKALPKKLPKGTPKVLRPGTQRDARDTASEGFQTALARQREHGGDLASTAEAFRAMEGRRQRRA